jgi:lysophospholipase L1-like esterase
MKTFVYSLSKAAGMAVLTILCRSTFATDTQAPVDTGLHAPPPVVVACVGDSITAYGNPHGYPAQLANMLGNQWKVENYGVSGTTLMTHANNPYQKYPMFEAALASKAGVVIIMLGTNDTKAKNWEEKSYFDEDYKALIDRFKAMDSKPRIYLMKPPFICSRNRLTMSDAAVLEEIPKIDQIVKDENVGVLDAHTPTAGQDNLFGDGVHPTTIGAGIIAKTVYEALTGKTYSGPIPNISH